MKEKRIRIDAVIYTRVNIQLREIDMYDMRFFKFAFHKSTFLNYTIFKTHESYYTQFEESGILKTSIKMTAILI